MLEYVNEPVSVEGQATAEGTTRPLAFTWQGRRYLIESWGRQSTKAQAGRMVRCYLVQTAGAETWELCQDKETAQWTLTRHWAVRHLVADLGAKAQLLGKPPGAVLDCDLALGGLDDQRVGVDPDDRAGESQPLVHPGLADAVARRTLPARAASLAVAPALRLGHVSGFVDGSDDGAGYQDGDQPDQQSAQY